MSTNNIFATPSLMTETLEIWTHLKSKILKIIKKSKLFLTEIKNDKIQNIQKNLKVFHFFYYKLFF
jgi:hypothetical protein